MARNEGEVLDAFLDAPLSEDTFKVGTIPGLDRKQVTQLARHDFQIDTPVKLVGLFLWHNCNYDDFSNELQELGFPKSKAEKVANAVQQRSAEFVQLNPNTPLPTYQPEQDAAHHDPNRTTVVKATFRNNPVPTSALQEKQVPGIGKAAIPCLQKEDIWTATELLGWFLLMERSHNAVYNLLQKHGCNPNQAKSQDLAGNLDIKAEELIQTPTRKQEQNDMHGSPAHAHAQSALAIGSANRSARKAKPREPRIDEKEEEYGEDIGSAQPVQGKHTTRKARARKSSRKRSKPRGMSKLLKRMSMLLLVFIIAYATFKYLSLMFAQSRHSHLSGFSSRAIDPGF